MPDWGLSQSERETEPWGLPEAVLKPAKVFTDPIHGDIHLNRLEVACVDSPPFQRLRRIKQLGETHLVYPGAVHTRFSHSLGALRLAQHLLDRVRNQGQGLHAVEDLLSDWGPDPELRWAEATVLARLGGLLHDLCHVPAGHTIEDDLGLLEPHDRNDERFEALWLELADSVLAATERHDDKQAADAVSATLLQPGGQLHVQLRGLIISKGQGVKPIDEMKYPFCADLVGNTICADLLDYLARDHLFAGLPHSLGRRFTSAFFIVGAERGPYSKRLALNIMRQEHERTDIVSELLKALRYRYELTERVLVHHAKLAADAMLGEAIERWGWALWYAEAKRAHRLDQGQFGGRFEAHKIPAKRMELEPLLKKMTQAEAVEKTPIRVAARKRLDVCLRSLGDEELIAELKRLPVNCDLPKETRPLLLQAAALASDLAQRLLFKPVTRVGPRDAPAEALWERFGDPDARAALELGAQRFARLGNDPKVIIWLPPLDMRLKLAEVLVRHSRGISPFVSYERAGRRRGSEIYDAHEALWAAYVFVHSEVRSDHQAVDRIVAYLAREMGVRWEGFDHLGDRPDQWPLRLAIAEIEEINRDSHIDEVFGLHQQRFEKLAARHSQPATYLGLRTEVSKVLAD
ncbi:MAG: HD domain-containing protein [Solirubrobacterales bacterium]